MKTIIPFFTFLFISITIHSQVYVSSTATGNNDGTTWNDAYTDLQDALDNATAGSQIWIKSGNYFPSNNILPDSNWYEVDKPLEIYGGFSGTETMLSERDWTTNITTLNGDLLGDDVANNFTTNREDNAHHVIVLTTNAGGASIDGITISGGHAQFDNLPFLPANIEPWSGSGIFFNASLVVRNCTIRQCHAGVGAAISNNYNTLQITDELQLENSIIEENNSDQSGVIIFNLGNAIIRACTLQNNINVSFGSLLVGNSNAQIEDCIFQNNEANDGIGGGLFAFQNGQNNVTNQTIEISRCDFLNNSAISGGGIMFNNFTDNSTLMIDSCYFNRNTADANNGVAGGLMIQNLDNTANGEMSSIAVTMSNCEFEENSGWRGGGVYLYSDYIFTGFDINNTTFTKNTATNFGGGLIIGNASGKVEDCTFSENEVFGSIGGGMLIFQNSQNQNPSPNIEVRRSDFENNTSGYGAGITFNNFYPNSQITIDSCLFYQNQAVANNSTGGGVQIQNILDTYGGGLSSLTPIILNSTFEENSAVDGGGAYIFSNYETFNTTIFNTNFEDNNASTGGGLFLETSNGSLMSSAIYNNEFTENTASIESAGIHLFGAGNNMMSNNIISENQSNGEAAALKIDGGAKVVMQNTLIANNTGVTSITNNDSLWMTNVTMAGNQQGLFQFAGAYTKIQNTILTNTEENYLGDNDATIESSGGNLSDDTTLLNVLLGFNGYSDFNNVNPQLNMDFGLEQNSVCIDNGNPDGVTTLFDLAGLDRVQGTEIDMGAFESSFTISIEDLENEKVKVFPNPFVERITISDVDGMTGIRLLDVLGREVQQFSVQKELHVRSNLSEGIYFLEFDFGGEKYLKKVEKTQ